MDQEAVAQMLQLVECIST